MKTISMIRYERELKIVIDYINLIYPKYKNLLALTTTQTARILSLSHTKLIKQRDQNQGVQFITVPGNEKSYPKIMYSKIDIAKFLLASSVK